MHSNLKKVLIGYGVVHGVVDFSCVAILFFALQSGTYHYFGGLFVFVLYSIVAFGLQFPFGILVDKFQVPRESAMIGLFLIGFALLFADKITLVAIIVGLGNAFFHVGGGSISLNFDPKKAASPGIFVAPGAIGLLLGVLFGKSAIFYHMWVPVMLLIISVVFIFFAKIPHISYQRKSLQGKIRFFYVAVILILLSVAIRALYGLTATYDWKQNITLLILLTLGVAGGKFVGGFVADRYGWVKTSVCALVISAPILVFFQNNPFLIICGAFLFQMTMPITLTLLSNIFPGRSATAFGAAATALIFGAIPTILDISYFFTDWWVSFGIIVLSATFLLISFKLLYTYCKDVIGLNL